MSAAVGKEERARAGARAEAVLPRATWLDRLAAALPVVSVFLWLAALYSWQAWRHPTPWLFTDELELTQLSRAIADTGSAARRGEPHFFQTLYAYVLAPAWWLGPVESAYGAVKLIGVVVMTAVAFPVYVLARALVSRPAALFAAAASASTPALAYGPMILEEPLAYPYAALSFLLFFRALVRPSRASIALALLACAVAPLVRGQLAVLVGVLVLAASLFFLTGPRGRSWIAAWTWRDWLGAVVLASGALVLFSAVAGYVSDSWLIATGHYRGRMLEYGLWAAGALAIGVGVLPALAPLATLVPARVEEPSPERRAFRSLLIAAIVAFGAYTAVKAAYLSTVFATRIEERNLIYLIPLLFLATALWMERLQARLLPTLAAAGFVAYLLVSTPLALDNVPYADALGLSIAQMANRNLAFDENAVQWALLAALGASVGLLLAGRALFSRPRAARALAALVGVLVLAWNLAGEVSAAKYSADAGRRIVRNFPRPLGWLDAITGGEPALYLGQNIDSGSALGVWLTEFWNLSLRKVWSLDGTARGPGPILTPDLAALDGRLYPDPGVRYVVVEPGIELDGVVVARPPRSGRWTVYRLRGPLRLAEARTGIYADGWTGAESAYNRYATPGGRPGYVVVDVSRAAWRGPDKPGLVTVRLGTLVKGEDKQPHLGQVTAARRFVIHSGSFRQLVLPTPRPPFRVEVRIAPTFSPADYPGSSDRRQLGAQVGFRFATERPRTRS
ncbi:MAG: hypothetical protein C4306_03305 [Thermoleophilia bacterium]